MTLEAKAVLCFTRPDRTTRALLPTLNSMLRLLHSTVPNLRPEIAHSSLNLHPDILANLSGADEGREEVGGDAETYVFQSQRRHLRHHLLGLPQPKSVDKQTREKLCPNCFPAQLQEHIMTHNTRSYIHIHIHMYICIYVYMYVSMYVCMYVCMHAMRVYASKK